VRERERESEEGGERQRQVGNSRGWSSVYGETIKTRQSDWRIQIGLEERKAQQSCCFGRQKKRVREKVRAQVATQVVCVAKTNPLIRKESCESGDECGCANQGRTRAW
jgi:hypothetical protein